MTVLEDAALTNHIKLRATTFRDTDIYSLRPLMKYTHRWKELELYTSTSWSRFDVDDFIDVFKPCLPHLEELYVATESVASSDIVLPPNSCPRLKTAKLTFITFSDLFNTGVLNFITSLTLKNIRKHDFPNQDAFKKALNDLPLVLS